MIHYMLERVTVVERIHKRPESAARRSHYFGRRNGRSLFIHGCFLRVQHEWCALSRASKRFPPRKDLVGPLYVSDSTEPTVSHHPYLVDQQHWIIDCDSPISLPTQLY